MVFGGKVVIAVILHDFVHNHKIKSLKLFGCLDVVIPRIAQIFEKNLPRLLVSKLKKLDIFSYFSGLLRIPTYMNFIILDVCLMDECIQSQLGNGTTFRLQSKKMASQENLDET